MSEARLREAATAPGAEIVRLLEAALAPVEPPGRARRRARVPARERQAAAIEALEELSDWELDAMRDPRNWVRPAAALAAGTAAGTALVVLRLRAVATPAPRRAAGASPSRAAGSCSDALVGPARDSAERAFTEPSGSRPVCLLLWPRRR